MRKYLTKVISVALAAAMLATVSVAAEEPQNESAVSAEDVSNTESTASTESPSQASLVTVNAKIEQGSVMTEQIGRFKYLLFSPKNPKDNMPLILYLHSYGPQGTDTGALWSSQGIVKYLQNKGANAVHAYVAIPLAPSRARDLPEDKVQNIDPKYTMSNGEYQWISIEPAVVELVNTLADQYKIDRNKISLIGLSAGADGAVSLLGKHPEMFCGAVLGSPYFTEEAQVTYEEAWVEGLKQVPLWVISEDEGTGPILTASIVESVKAAGGTVWYDRHKGISHRDVTSQYFPNSMKDPVRMIPWLLTLSKETETAATEAAVSETAAAKTAASETPAAE